MSNTTLSSSPYVPVFKQRGDSLRFTLGLNTSSILSIDPKLILFTLAKYKFAGKLLSDCEKVLDVGCMDGFGTLLLSSFVGHVDGIDSYPEHIEEANNSNFTLLGNISFKCIDLFDTEITDEYDGITCFDVWEHISPEKSTAFLNKIAIALKPSGLLIIGVPSLESQIYASKYNRESHVNCMARDVAYQQLKLNFSTVLRFSMNDEVIHTGFHGMAHYNIFVCTR